MSFDSVGLCLKSDAFSPRLFLKGFALFSSVAFLSSSTTLCSVFSLAFCRKCSRIDHFAPGTTELLGGCSSSQGASWTKCSCGLWRSWSIWASTCRRCTCSKAGCGVAPGLSCSSWCGWNWTSKSSCETRIRWGRCRPRPYLANQTASTADRFLRRSQELFPF